LPIDEYGCPKMDDKTFEALVAKLWEDGTAIRLKKRQDYADNTDVLGNLRRMGKVIADLRVGKVFDKNPALGTAIIYMLLKIDRLVNLTLKDVQPVNESKRDTWIDLLQYTLLAFASDTE
jgi:hypothetical protein